MTRRQWIASFAVSTLIVLTLMAIILPHPRVWEHLFSEPDFPRAYLAAYRIALGIDRPSGVPLNAITYTFLIFRRYPNDIVVVFLPHSEVRQLLPGEPAEAVDIILRRPDMHLVRWYFEAD